MSSLTHWQMAGALTGFSLALVSIVTAAGMKNWVHLPVRGPSARRCHTCSAWASLAIYLIISFSCLKYHFSITDPLSALDYGWFMVHPFNGFLGIFLYLGKILIVRMWKKGWKAPGIVFGGAILLFWLTQVGTIVPALLAWIG